MWSWLWPQKSVRGDVVLITGGAMGIGRLMALKFAELGALVIVWDVHEKLGSETVQEIRRHYGGQAAHFYHVDITDKDQVYATANEMLETFGHVDILVNNAGIVGGRPLLESDDRTVERTMQVNVLAHFWTIKAFLPAMIQRDKGHIVGIASVAGLMGCAGMVDYSASKFAVVGMMSSLRQELMVMGKHEQIKLTLVCPSLISTGMFEGAQPPKNSKTLTPKSVADQVVAAVRRNEWRLVLPWNVQIMEFFLVSTPNWFSDFVVHVSGISRIMAHFKQTRTHTLLEESAKAA